MRSGVSGESIMRQSRNPPTDVLCLFADIDSQAQSRVAERSCRQSAGTLTLRAIGAYYVIVDEGHVSNEAVASLTDFFFQKVA